MGLLLAFAPFMVFAVLDRFVGPTAGLFAAAGVSAVLLAKDRFTGAKSPKILEVGAFVLFATLAAWAAVSGRPGSVFVVRLLIDAGLLAIVLISIALRRPFTIQYARERTSPELWNSPEFRRVNYIITWAWAAAFTALVVADAVLAYAPSIPPRFGVIAVVGALLAAFKFTAWYPTRASRAEHAVG